jgi:SAM-dependent methyltransferase
VRCPVCGSREVTRWAEVAPWRYVACSTCDLVRLAPLPSEEMAAGFYDDTYFTGSAHRGYADYVADETVHRANARRHLRRLERRGATKPGRLVEIGAAAGFLLDEARRRGWRVDGVEVAASMRDAARDLHGIDLATAVDELDGRDAIDVVVANQVLEHTVDPLGLLTDLHARMATGGTVSIETWDRGALVARALGPRWQQVNPPSVLWLWDARQLCALLDRAGFDVVVCRPAVKLVSVATVAGQLGLTGRFGRLPLPYGLGDLNVVIARARREAAAIERAA